MSVATQPVVASPPLPSPRGPMSAAVVEALRGRGAVPAEVGTADPYGDDLQLTLTICYELHYRGWAGVSDAWEWSPDLLRLRNGLEDRFLTALRSDADGDADVASLLDDLLVEPVDGSGVTHFLRDEGEWWQVRELFAHRSIYHLKEADPHAWVIPRLRGRAKAALVAVEFDEFGGGRAERMHSRLFADLLAGAGLDPSYLGYLDAVPAPMLANVNLMSMFGLHRGLRGALVGHFAAAEITTAPSAQRMVHTLERLGADPACVHFYAEHIEADAVHEQVMRHDVVDDLLHHEPELAADVAFGIRATDYLEERFGEQLLGCWRRGKTSLLKRLTAP
jgi:hypothetical protein